MLASFRPASWMFQWARVVATALADGLRPPTHERLATQLGVHRVTITKAWGRAEVREWLAAQLRVDHDTLTDLIKRRVAGQALAGSERHQRLWFELIGDLRRGPVFGEEPGGGGRGGWSVTISNIPLPPTLEGAGAQLVGAGATVAAGA